MKKYWKLLVFVLVVGVIAADLILDWRAGSGPTEQGVPADPAVASLPVGTQLGERALDFSGLSLDGEEIRLSDQRGKTVLVNVFASWCGPCRLEAPHLVEAFRSLDADEYTFIGLNLLESPAAVRGFRDEFGIEFPLVLNQDGALTEIYAPIGLPTSWIVDPQGVVRYVHAGPVTSKFLIEALEDVQAGREPDPFSTAG